MVVEKEQIASGVTLAARYKGEIVKAEVTADAEGKLQYTVNGETFNSPSKAGSKAAGGTSVNGYRFWSLESELGEGRKAAEPKAKVEKAAKTKATKAPEKRGVPNISKARKQPDDLEAGMVLYFCSACMKGFQAPDAGRGKVPAACPEGHARNYGNEMDEGNPTTDEPEVATPAAEEVPVELDI